MNADQHICASLRGQRSRPVYAQAWALLFSLFCTAIFSLPPIQAQQPPAAAASNGHGVVRAVRITEAIRVDGDLSEAAWEGAEAAVGFTQSEPSEGQPATERTEVKILYDD